MFEFLVELIVFKCIQIDSNWFKLAYQSFFWHTGRQKFSLASANIHDCSEIEFQIGMNFRFEANWNLFWNGICIQELSKSYLSNYYEYWLNSANKSNQKRWISAVKMTSVEWQCILMHFGGITLDSLIYWADTSQFAHQLVQYHCQCNTWVFS